MPRVGLDSATIVAAGAALADEVGFAELTMGQVAQRVGVRTPSLYKHIASQGELNRGIAALALAEVADAIGMATQGRSGRDALAAAARAMRDFVLAHPGRYAATIGLTPTGPDDPIAIAESRGLGAFAGVLRAYHVAPEEMTHALRALRSVFHGFASLQSARGFQWSTDIDESFEWLINLVDLGLRAAAAGGPADPPRIAP